MRSISHTFKGTAPASPWRPGAPTNFTPRRGGRLCASLLLVPLLALAQQPSTRLFTLEEAVTYALGNYPAIRAASEQTAAARAGVSLARTSYLPRADMLWQSNRATRNNIAGLLLPQSVIPPISGPVPALASNSSVWGSGAGLLLSWEPFDFGLRRATVEAAESTEARAQNELSLTRLDVAAAAADAFLAVVAAQERVRGAQANLERREVFAKVVHALADQQLRPGADASRADAEMAAARILLLQAQEVERVSRVGLAQALGIAGTDIQVQQGSLLRTPPDQPPAPPKLASHPLAAVDRARIEESRAQLQILERTYFPRFSLQSAVSGRGSGVRPDGSLAGGSNGLGPDRSNWAVGLTVTFPLADFASLRARKEIEAANERREVARYDQSMQQLTGQWERARAAWEVARQIAANTPIQLQAAQATETQARARYQSGLAGIVEVADAQRLVVEAEIEDALARLSVWRGLFLMATAQGDLQPFLEALRAKTSGGD